MEILKKVYNTNLLVDETLRLLNSMVNCGESHSRQSQSMIEQSLKELNLQRKEIMNELV